MKGRRPKPTSLKLLAGNPGKRELNDREPQYEPATEEVPAELLDPKTMKAKEEWQRVVPLLIAAGVAKKIDRTALIAYCFEYQRWIDAEEQIRVHGIFVKTKQGLVTINPYCRVSKHSLEMMCRFMSEFGMTPSARVRIKADIPVKEVDPMEAFLKSRESA